jgi:hypothetical protein
MKHCVICFLVIPMSIYAMHNNSSRTLEHYRQYQMPKQLEYDMTRAIEHMDASTVHNLVGLANDDLLMMAAWCATEQYKKFMERLKNPELNLKQLEFGKDTTLRKKCNLSCKARRNTTRSLDEKNRVTYCEERRKKLQSPIELSDSHYRHGHSDGSVYLYGRDRDGKEPANIYEQAQIAHSIMQEIQAVRAANSQKNKQ